MNCVSGREYHFRYLCAGGDRNESSSCSLKKLLLAHEWSLLNEPFFRWRRRRGYVWGTRELESFIYSTPCPWPSCSRTDCSTAAEILLQNDEMGGELSYTLTNTYSIQHISIRYHCVLTYIRHLANATAKPRNSLVTCVRIRNVNMYTMYTLYNICLYPFSWLPQFSWRSYAFWQMLESLRCEMPWHGRRQCAVRAQCIANTGTANNSDQKQIHNLFLQN